MATVHQISASGGGVPKTPLDRAAIDINGVVGDDQTSKKYHGGPDRALVPSELEGIELYTPMQVPPEFATSDSSCGVVVVWTKRGS